MILSEKMETIQMQCRVLYRWHTHVSVKHKRVDEVAEVCWVCWFFCLRMAERIVWCVCVHNYGGFPSMVWAGVKQWNYLLRAFNFLELKATPPVVSKGQDKNQPCVATGSYKRPKSLKMVQRSCGFTGFVRNKKNTESFTCIFSFIRSPWNAFAKVSWNWTL